MKRGYARVSTVGQDLDIQVAALRQAGCEKLYTDKATGKNVDRAGLKRMLREATPGDVVVVYKVDRISRSARDLLNIAYDLAQQKVEFRSLNDPIDTASVMGRGFFQMLGVFAEMERGWIVERTTNGRRAARMRGVKFGRKAKLTNEQLVMARDLLARGDHTMTGVAKSFGVHRATLWRALS